MTARRYGLLLAVVVAGGVTNGFIDAATGIDQIGSMVMFLSGAAVAVLIWGDDQ